MGLRGSETAELIFDNCRVPAENLLGKEGKGFSMDMQALDSARIGTGAQGIGIAQGAIDLSVKYMNERVQFGKPIAALQGLQWYIAEMATRTEAAKWLVYHAAFLHDTGKPFTKEAAMCKLNASEMPALSQIWLCKSMVAMDICMTILWSVCSVTPRSPKFMRVLLKFTRL